MNNWQIKKLGDIAEITKGKFLNKDDISNSGKTPCIHYGELFIKYSEIIKNVIGKTDISKGVFYSKQGDVLMPTSDVTPRGLATASYLPFDNVIIGGDILVVRPNKNQLDGKFYSYFVAASKSTILRLTSGSTIFHLYGSDIKKMKLNLPSKTEQQRIVSVLETWDEYLELLDKKSALKERLKKGLMQQLLTGKKRLPGFCDEWENMVLGKLAKIQSGGTPDSKNDSYYGGDIPWVSITDMTSANKYISKTNKNLSESGLWSSSARIYPKGTVLYAMYASIGECVISLTELSSSQAILGIQVKDKLNNEYLYFILNSIKQKIKLQGQQGTQSNLNAEIVKNIKILLPSVKEQQAIVDVLNSADQVIETLTLNKSLLTKQKKYLLKNLITGAIRTPENLKIKEANNA